MAFEMMRLPRLKHSSRVPAQNRSRWENGTTYTFPGLVVGVSAGAAELEKAARPTEKRQMRVRMVSLYYDQLQGLVDCRRRVLFVSAAHDAANPPSPALRIH